MNQSNSMINVPPFNGKIRARTMSEAFSQNEEANVLPQTPSSNPLQRLMNPTTSEEEVKRDLSKLNKNLDNQLS